MYQKRLSTASTCNTRKLLMQHQSGIMLGQCWQKLPLCNTMVYMTRRLEGEASEHCTQKSAGLHQGL